MSFTDGRFTGGRHNARFGLMDLPDLALLHVMHYLDPLPDIFALQLSCKRFYELAHDSRAWITVSPSDDPRSPTASQHHHEHIVGRSCESLPHAIRMAKPGDTILLREGTHRVASTLVLSVPLRILGPAFDTRVAGTLPGAARTRGIIRPDTIDSDTSETPGRETCIIIGHSGVDPVIDLRKTAVVRGLRIVSKRGCCIHHRGGSALIEGSSLESRARALNFLYPPLLTSAVSGAMQSPYVGPCALSSPGKVTVRDTLIEGGSEAVTCLGSGAVSSVRCVYSALSPPLFWFVVASASARQARPRRITKRRWCPESEPGEAQAGGALAVGNAVVREGEWAGERVGRSGRGRREGENTERAGAAEKGRESEWEAWVSALSGPSAGARNPGGRGDLVCARCSDLQGLQGAPDAGPKEGEGTRGGRPSSGGSQSQGGEAAADAGGGRSMLDLIEEEMAARNRPRSLCCYCGHEILS